MKVYVQTDIEGVAGFVFFENRKDTSPENCNHRQRMRRLLSAEVNAAVRASFDAGADEVVVNDSHGSGYNILFEELDPRCEICHGRNCSGAHWLNEFDDSYDAMVQVGMHAMGGTPGAVLSHSKWVVNGGEVFLSEGTMAAAIAGDLGVPCVFASGDDKITGEFREKIPGIETAQVKKALGCYIARSVMPARACDMIYEGVTRGLKRRREIAPYRIPGPVKLNLADNAKHVPPLPMVRDEDIEAPTINEAFMAFEEAMGWTSFNTDVPDGFTYP